MTPDDNWFPRLETKRLILRGFLASDAPHVQLLAGDSEIAATTEQIPHPYPDGEAERWISTHAESYAKGQDINFAIVERSTNELIGAISLLFRPDHRRASLGYWIGKPYWNNGYASEAVKAVIDYAFSQNVYRVWAMHMTSNRASGKVMQSAGMTYEGTLKAHMLKDGVFHDCEVYGIIAD